MHRYADDHVFDFLGRYLWIALQQRVDHMGDHVIGASEIEAPAKRLRESGTHVVYDYDVFHC